MQTFSLVLGAFWYLTGNDWVSAELFQNLNGNVVEMYPAQLKAVA